MNLIRMKTLPDWLRPLGGDAAESSAILVAPSVAPSVAPLDATSVSPMEASHAASGDVLEGRTNAWPGVAAAVAPRPEEPVYGSVEEYPGVRPMQPTTRVAWPTRMDTTGYGEMRALLALDAFGQPKAEVRRLWVDGRHPTDPPGAAEHAYQLLRWLQAQPFFAGHLIPASDLRRLYPAFCTSLALWPQPWQTVSNYLRRLTGGKRLHRRIGGNNVRVFPIPLPQRE